MFEMIAEKFSELITGTLNSWVEEFLRFVLTWINELVFKLPTNDFASQTLNFFMWFTTLFSSVLVLYKIIEYIINTQNGTQQYPLDEILLRVIKSAVAMLVLPWLLRVIFLQIALPIASYFTAAGTKFNGSAGYTVLTTFLTTGRLGLNSGGIVFLIFSIFFLVVFLMFLYSVCIFYADFLLMQILIAPVALSMIADDNNYFQVWWRELLSQVVSLLTKLFLVTLIINIIFSGNGTVVDIMLAIGSGALIIKSPSVLKNMWYGGGGAKATTRGAGTVISMSSRTLLSNLLK